MRGSEWPLSLGPLGGVYLALCDFSNSHSVGNSRPFRALSWRRIKGRAVLASSLRGPFWEPVLAWAGAARPVLHPNQVRRQQQQQLSAGQEDKQQGYFDLHLQNCRHKSKPPAAVLGWAIQDGFAPGNLSQWPKYHLSFGQLHLSFAPCTSFLNLLFFFNVQPKEESWWTRHTCLYLDIIFHSWVKIFKWANAIVCFWIDKTQCFPFIGECDAIISLM